MPRFLRAFLSGLDGLLLGLFGAGYAAAYVPPEAVWWLQVLAVGLPFLSLGVAGAAVVVALAGRWRRLAIHLVALGLILGRFFPGIEARPATAPGLTVMSFNAAYKYWTGGDDVPDTWAAHVRDMAAVMARERPDVAALQGVGVRFPDGRPSPSQPHIRALLEAGYQTRPPDSLRGALTPPVFSRIPQRETTMWIPPGEAEEADRYPVVRTVLVWQGREFAVYNLHLRSFYDDGRRPWEGGFRHALRPDVWIQWLAHTRDDFVARAGEARFVRALLDAETRPFLVCGDFNATPHNWSYRTISRGLTDVFRVRGRGFGGTYHARLPLLRIDHILAGPGWRVAAAEARPVAFSDHHLMTARLALDPP